MARLHISKESPVIIVGAGVFGLSTSIHLAKRGYSNVTVFDRHPYHISKYSYFEGADAASADLNKIIRSAYGDVSIYQDLSLQATEVWRKWNAEIAQGSSLPPDMKSTDRVFIPNGNLCINDGHNLSPFDLASIKNMEAAGITDSQLVTTDPRHRQLAQAKGFGFAMDPFQRERRGQPNVAVLDTTGGTAIADKACCYAMHKARSIGVRFVLGEEVGQLVSLIHSSTNDENAIRVSGIRTADGKHHPAELTILACGGWTPSILPKLDGLCETTAGSVVLIKIPRQSKLWYRLDPERFPTWTYKMRDGAEGGLYGFARDDEGWLKVGYRGTKYTNPLKHPDGEQRSVPVTRWTCAEPGGERLTSIPQQALSIIQRFLDDNLPELAEEGLGIAKTRMCWYNDSFDNHLVVDYVPNTIGLFVATGGSGHGFKYLPVLGDYIVDAIESKDLERPLLQAWHWRRLGVDQRPANVLMEGTSGVRALGNVPLVSEAKITATVSTAKL